MVQSISKNYFFTLLRLSSSFLFPIVTFPYITRVLGSEKLGAVNYVLSIAQYFIIFTGLGISVYGIREIGKVINDRSNIQKVFTELVTIRIVNTIVVFAIFLVMTYCFDLTLNDSKLFWISCVYLILQIGVVDWLFQGLGNVKTIAIRTLISKFAVLIGLFVFVKSQDDYWIYYLLLVLDTLGSFIYGIYISGKYLNWSIKLDLKRHYKPMLWLFSVQFAVSIYIYLDKIMLGSLSQIQEVGYYTTGIKIVKVVQTFITSIGLVVLPVLSSVIHDNNKVNSIVEKILNFLIFFSIPMIIGIITISPELVVLFAGIDFAKSSDILIVLSFIILFVALSNLYGTQLLVAGGKEKKFFLITLIGAGVNITLNIILIPHYDGIGAAISTVITEFVVAIGCILIAYRVFSKIPLPKLSLLLRTISVSALFFVTEYLLKEIAENNLTYLVSQILCCIVIYFSIQKFVFDDPTSQLLITKISQKVKKNEI